MLPAKKMRERERENTGTEYRAKKKTIYSQLTFGKGIKDKQ